MEIHICSITEYDNETRVPTIVNPNSSTFYLVPTEDGTSPDLFTEWVYVDNAWEMFGSASIDLSGYLTDVKVGGNSIVNDGIANIPLATADTAGVVKVDPYAGTSYGGIVALDNKLYVVGAPFSNIKYGGDYSKPVVAANQHAATFYGLAKAAGADEKNSTLAFGTYSDNAKSKIQNMLGITDKYSPKEWVAESETELVTNAHSVGDLFYIGETLYKVIADLNAGDAINVGVNVEEVNANDILDDYATKQEIENNINIVEKNNSGSIASFNDGADNVPLKSLIVDINPVQDFNGYDSPWVGGTGKNLLEVSEVNIEKPSYYSGTWEGTTIADAKENSITVSRTSSQGGFAGVVISNGLKAGTYTFSCDVPTTTGVKNFYIGYAENGVFSGQLSLMGAGVTVTHPTKSFTLENDTDSFYIKMTGASEDDMPLTFSHLQIEEGSTATDYVPYENICPITGWTGAKVTHFGKNCILNGADRKTITTSLYAKYTPVVSLKDATSVTFSVSADVPSGQELKLFGYTGQNNNLIGNLTLQENGRYALTGTKNIKAAKEFRIYSQPYTGGSSVVTTVWDCSCVVDEIRTDYIPYQGRTINVNWETEAGTVYGGRLDVISGKLTVDRAMVDLGTLDWEYDTGFNSFRSRYSITDALSHSYSVTTGLFTSIGLTELGKMAEDAADLTIVLNSSAHSKNSLFIKYLAYDDVSTFKSAMSGVQMCYYLATSIEYQLAPQEVKSILGTNNIFADTGDTSVEYFSQVDEDLIDYIKVNLNSYAKKELLNNYVDDVQINGSSIVTDGVASIPMADDTHLGAVVVNGAYGIGRFGTNGALYINYPTSAYIKSGTNNYRPIVPSLQHESVFYGLAKIAGYDEKNSTLAVGTYTNEAKTAIKQMLGIHDTIDSFVEEVTGTDVTITGQPSYRYNCGELYSLTVTPPSSGTIDIRFTSGSTPTVLTLPSTVKMPEWWVEVEANTIYEMCITDGIYCGVMTWAI